MRLTEAGRPERAVLVALDGPEVDEHLDELESLVRTAGGLAVARAVQKRAVPDSATLVGQGFAKRLAVAAEELDAQSVVFDDELTPSQAKNLERIMPSGVKVLDRSAVILDIFARHARTREAKTQVELAQLRYLLPRLTRRWTHLSRQAGGIGTRGVGEKQLEIDKRIIGKRIAQLRRELGKIEVARRVRRRRRGVVPTVAVVGYTNAGKTSLFNALTGAREVAEDKLFATLDPRSRRADLGLGLLAVVTDTVGFIRKLPHELVAPFRSTLEEALDADVVLHVVDRSHREWESHLRVGQEVLDRLEVPREKVVVVLNKIDRVEGSVDCLVGLPSVAVSAVEGTGLGALRSLLRRRLAECHGLRLVRLPLSVPEVSVLMASSSSWGCRVADGHLLALLPEVRVRELGLEAYQLGVEDADL